MKIYNYLVILILLASFVYGADSTTKEDYYFYETYYWADNLDGNNESFDGTTITEGLSSDATGWDHTGGYLASHWTSEKVYNNQLTRKFTAAQGDTDYYNFAVGNSTFTGRVDFKFLINTTSTDYYFTSFVGSTSVAGFLAVNDAWSGWGDNSIACSDGTPPYTPGQWQNLTFNYTGGGIVDTYVDGVLCKQYTGINSLDKIWIYVGGNTHYASYIADFKISDGNEIPSIDVDSTPPIITVDSPINNSVLYYPIFINVTINEDGNCALNNSDFILNSSTTTNFRFKEDGISKGNYNIAINCTDDALNPNSAIINFTKSIPEVSILSPPNSSSISGTEINVTFQFYDFDPNFCQLWANATVDGSFQSISNITSGTQNITDIINSSDIRLNLTDVLNYYDFEESSGSTVIDKALGNNGTNSNAEYTSSKIGNGTGNYSLYFTSDTITAPNQGYYNFGTGNDFSLSAWINSTHNSDSQYHMIIDTRDGGNDGVFMAITTSDTIQCVADASSMESITTIEGLGSGEWNHIVCVWDRDDAGTSDIYINGVPEGVGVTSTSQDIQTSNSLYIGERAFSTGIYWEGNLDQIIIYNKSLSSTDVTYLYDNGIYAFIENVSINVTEINITLNQSTNYTLQCIPPNETVSDVAYIVQCKDGFDINSSELFVSFSNDFIAPIISVISPAILNVTYNFDVWINFTTNEFASCILNNSGWTKTQDNGTYFAFRDDGNNNTYYNIDINCTDTANNLRTENILFTKDVLYPNIIPITPSINNNTQTDNIGEIRIHFNTFDERDLYSINVLIYDGINFTDDILYNDSLIVTGQSYTYDEMIDTHNWTNSSKLVYYRVCDSHTNNNIKEANNIIKKKDNLKFQFGETVIHIKAMNPSSGTGYSKKKDRYEFSFSYSEHTPVKEYKITSNQDIIYRPLSDYKGHFVVGEHWVDFEQDGDVVAEKVCEEENNITECFYKVTVENDDNDITFRSIGELNCYDAHIKFDLLAFLDGYSLRRLSSNFFNTKILDASTTSGVLMFIFLFIILIALFIVSELTRIPALYLFTGLYCFFYALLLTVSISIIIGIILFFVSVVIWFRGFNLDD